MPRCIASLFVLGLTCSVLSAQVFTDPFALPVGTNIPGYTEQRGDWMVTPLGVQGAAATLFQELTYDAITDSDCAVEVLARYDVALGQLQYVGPLLRHSGSGASATYFMVKVQDNGTPYTGFDNYYTYFYNGGGFVGFGLNGLLPQITTEARVRLQCTDVGGSVLVQIYIDTDMDGRWNVTGEATTPNGFGTSGRIGCCGYRNAIAGRIDYFNATLDPVGLPTLGTALTINGQTQPNLLYLGAASLGHSGFAVPGGVVPLDYDGLFAYSLTDPVTFQNFFAVVSPTGGFAMTLNIPNIPTLSGTVLWIAAVGHDGMQVAEITQDIELLLL